MEKKLIEKLIKRELYKYYCFMLFFIFSMLMLWALAIWINRIEKVG
ncbi:MAG: hypothetical protein MRECE_10c040 [Mycoplasmataceae bacterium CE_OT135]|nr:MAG: hypothetical protein MRECE_10c040 [Mycoplasmataceae bacterium CE_OT135]